MTSAIGTPGIAWGPAERAQWRATQTKRRSYADDVLAALAQTHDLFTPQTYGELDHTPDGRYPLVALRSRAWRDGLPVVLVTGGVHGYETSGVHGALRFATHAAADFAGRVNLLVVPCVSPWGYERIHRWNPDAVDPNRSFKPEGTAPEARLLTAFLAPYRGQFLAHLDLHETTDSDESEFRPALAARDGKVYEPGIIPDGFYLVDDAENPQTDFQRAIIDAVARVTHIAAPDETGLLLGEREVSRGVIQYPVRALGLCAGVTGARFTTTTEVYPDSPRSTPAQCNEAQVTAVRAGITYALAHA
ncbi:MAG: M14 family metallocarboxypeptidase [Polyangiales bacterium]